MCYLHVPYFSTLTKGIRRLNILWRGPFAISQIKDNEKQLVKLIKVSDLSESEKWYPVHRIKLTKYGLDPPSYPYIEGFTVDYDLSGESVQDLTVDKFLSQPWDDNSLKDEGIQIMPDGDEIEDEVKIAEEPTREVKESTLKQDKNADVDINYDNKTFRFKCKIPPRIQIQRMGKLMEYYEKGLLVAQLIVQVLSTMSMKYKRFIVSWQYPRNGYVCVTGPLPFLQYLAY